MGLTRDGFFAESKAMLPRSLIPIPSTVSDEEAAIVEPVALALRVLDYMKPNLGDWVTIIGQGRHRLAYDAGGAVEGLPSYRSRPWRIIGLNSARSMVQTQ